MPFFEYKCEDCGETFEFFARASSDKPECCQECGKGNLKKLFSSFGFKSGSASAGDLRSSAASSACGTCTAGSCSGCTGN